jgi:hypothetical protein
MIFVIKIQEESEVVYLHVLKVKKDPPMVVMLRDLKKPFFINKIFKKIFSPTQVHLAIEARAFKSSFFCLIS